ncbi:hypothetical protein C485_17832 [Natrinema altunense JCM 12890]|uniref:Uncharacterized protein n=1 Tax=Natrinema altunense (strain JCM 12890 / CGMCC 1.3731 / AJ2) TaxID=1227494 RepID=L9ZDG6_NATA2|nr:hypothetical protein C485_17832 [Natrinema altunense JCM 12890]
MNQISVKEISSLLTEYAEDDYSEDTVRNIIKGLCGQKKNVPKKYYCSERYLKEVEYHPDNSINYDVTQDGRALLGSLDTVPNLRVLTSGGDSLSDSLEELGLERVEGDGRIRPHKCWWREEIKRKPGGETGNGLSWGDRRTVLMEKEIPFEVYDKEVPGREQSERGELIQYNGWNVILFEDTILVRYDRPVQADSIFGVLDDWWSTRNEIVDWVQSEFPVLVRSKPVDVSMPLSTQEWGDVRNEFAEWIQENPEFQDDSPNSLFEVKNDRGERVFHIDTSPTDGLGNDLAEGEFPHSQFGAEHITNLKQAVKWMATLGVKPQDFSAAMWTRENRDELEKVVEFDAEELEDQVRQLEGRIESVALDAAEQRQSLDEKVDEFQERVSRRLDEQDERIRDVVERVDSTRRELEDEVGRLQRDDQALASAVRSNSKVNRLQSEKLVQVADRLDDVASQLETNDRYVLEEVKSNRQKNRMQGQRQEELLKEVRELRRDFRRLEERSIFDKARSAVGDVKESVKSAAGKMKEKVANLW